MTSPLSLLEIADELAVLPADRFRNARPSRLRRALQTLGGALFVLGVLGVAATVVFLTLPDETVLPRAWSTASALGSAVIATIGVFVFLRACSVRTYVKLSRFAMRFTAVMRVGSGVLAVLFSLALLVLLAVAVLGCGSELRAEAGIPALAGALLFGLMTYSLAKPLLSARPSKRAGASLQGCRAVWYLAVGSSVLWLAGEASARTDDGSGTIAVIAAIAIAFVVHQYSRRESLSGELAAMAARLAEIAGDLELETLELPGTRRRRHSLALYRLQELCADGVQEQFGPARRRADVDLATVVDYCVFRLVGAETRGPARDYANHFAVALAGVGDRELRLGVVRLCRDLRDQALGR